MTRLIQLRRVTRGGDNRPPERLGRLRKKNRRLRPPKPPGGLPTIDLPASDSCLRHPQNFLPTLIARTDGSVVVKS